MLKQGKIGVLHWATHVQAQRDNLDGKITVEEMKARFKKTRLKGPDDLKRYNDAMSAYNDLKGSCAEGQGRRHCSGSRLGKVRKAQQGSAGGAEGDSCRHEGLEGSPKADAAQCTASRLAPHRRHESTWLKQFHAAPKNIKAFKKATADFKAPGC